MAGLLGWLFGGGCVTQVQTLVDQSRKRSEERALASLEDRARTNREQAKMLREVGMNEYGRLREEDAVRTEQQVKKVRDGKAEIVEALNDVLGVEKT
ncbi:MAG: hypothetical protein ACFB50_10875 [Rubrobacteraceae bacterium]